MVSVTSIILFISNVIFERELVDFPVLDLDAISQTLLFINNSTSGISLRATILVLKAKLSVLVFVKFSYKSFSQLDREMTKQNSIAFVSFVNLIFIV